MDGQPIFAAPAPGAPLPALCAAYGLGEPGTVTALRPGTAARAWRLDTAGGAVVIRTLSGPEQGEREGHILRHLRKKRFLSAPELLSTLTGAAWVELEGACWQLQRFCPGTVPDGGKAGTVRAAAALAAELTSALSDCPAVGPGEGQVIHGDLGPWNLLDTEAGLVVLDFGTARMGDSYFDLAALLAGFINHAAPADRPRVLAEFLDGAGRPDRGRLLEQLRQWAAVNTAAWSVPGRPGAAEMLPKFQNARIWAEEALA